MIETALVVGVISGVMTAIIAGVDSALAGNDPGQILVDAGTGFLIGFSVGALLTLIGPTAFAKIAPYVPYLLLLLGGWGAYDSFSNGHIAQGVFRIIATTLSVGTATPAARAKIQQFAKYLWGKIFPAKVFPAPTLVGSPVPDDGVRVVLYNSSTKEVWVCSARARTDLDAILESGWTNVPEELLIGGHAEFHGGTPIIRWISGFFLGTPALAEEAAAAYQLATAPVVVVPPPASNPRGN